MKQKKSLNEVVQKNYPDFADEVAGLSVDQLDARLVQNAKDSEANDQAKEDDGELEQAHTHVANLAAPYRDARKVLRLKAKYIIQLLKEKGGQ